MSVKIEKLEGNIVKLDFELDAKLCAAEYDKACSFVAKKVNIPGFRPGKAPKALVEKNVGKDYIQKEALDKLLPKMLSEAISEHQLDMVAEPMLESVEFNIDKPTKAVVKIELAPEVELGKYKGLQVEAEEFKTDKKAMDEELKKIQEKFATQEPVKEKRATEKTDVVTIDFEGTCEGELIKGGAAKGYTLDLANSNFIPGFAEALVGKSMGEEFAIDVNFPKEYHDEALKGKPAQFKVTLHEIKTKVMPKLDDALAEKTGRFKTMDELKADIEKYLKEFAKNENEKRKTAKVFETVTEAAKVDIQDSMVSREADAMLEDFKRRIEMQGGNFEKALSIEGKDKVMADLKEEAKSRIKNSLVINKIATIEKLEVKPEEFNAKLDELAKMYGMPKESVLQELQKNPSIVSQLSQQVINQKVTELLLANNTVSFVEKKKK